MELDLRYWLKRIKSPLHPVCLIFLLGCTKTPNKIEPLIEFNYQTMQVDLCQSYLFDWDSILVVRPYTRYTGLRYGLKLKNIGPIKDELKMMESIDWKHYLLFIKGDRAVIAYSEIPDQLAHFGFKESIDGPWYIYRDSCKLNFSREDKIARIQIP